jgi:hypothetical protein
MSDVLSNYGTANQAITITLGALANNGQRESTVIDNTSNKFLNALVQLKVKTGGSGTSSSGYLVIYAYGTSDDGTTYGDGATGSDAGITLNSPPNLQEIGRIYVAANATTYKSNPLSVAAAFGGVLPKKWGIVVENKTGGTLDATDGNHAVFYQGVAAVIN